MATTTTEFFELPPTVLEEDVVLLQNILTALHSLPAGTNKLCTRYKVEPLEEKDGYLVRGSLPANTDFFEITLDDLLFLQSVSPARITSVAVGRTGGPVELFIRVLDARQRIMVQSTTAFSSATRLKRARNA
jgi:hypothetical protein